MADLLIRVATDDDVAAAGALTAHAYGADGLVPDGDDYVEELMDAARRAREATLLVARTPADDEPGPDHDGVSGSGTRAGSPELAGTITVAPAGTSYAEIAEPGEVELRMLAVAPEARRRGVAEALMRAAMREAVTLGAQRVVLSSLETMTAAHRLYDRLRFDRAPGRDWHHEDVALRVYTWDVPAGPGAEVESAAWPALEVHDVDGWHVGLSGGFTRRANCVVATGEPRDVPAALAEVERLYATAGQPAVFRVCRQSRPEDLDELLAPRGYREVAPTLVMVRDGLDAVASPFDSEGLRCTVADEPDEDWLTRWLDVRASAPVDHGLARRLLGGARSLYLTARDGRAAVGVVRVALVGDWAGLACLAVDARARRRGVGRALIRAALREASERGARRAFLQVQESNEVAVEVYTGLGFAPAERYHYRQR